MAIDNNNAYESANKKFKTKCVYHYQHLDFAPTNKQLACKQPETVFKLLF